MTKSTISSYVQGFYIGDTPGDTLVITATGTVGGFGVEAGPDSARTLIRNDGTISAAVGSVAASSNGILLPDGGSVMNGDAEHRAALISAFADGIRISGGRGTVSNFGTIDARGQYYVAVSMTAGGTVTNGSNADTTARIIFGLNGVDISGGAGTIKNFGTILGRESAIGRLAVYLRDGGSVVNGSAGDRSAVIECGNGPAIQVQGASGTVDNLGTVSVGAYTAIVFSDGGRVVNGSASDTTALIHSRWSAVSGTTGGVENFGTIESGSGAQRYAINEDGGKITNGAGEDTTALIAGNIQTNGTCAIVNLGTIMGTVALRSGWVLNGSATDEHAAIGALSFRSYKDADCTNFGVIGGVYSSASNSHIVNGSSADTAATIFATRSEDAVDLTDGTGSFLVNYGTVVAASTTRAGGNGVSLWQGDVTNGTPADRHALIEGRAAGVLVGDDGTVDNFGIIRSTGSGHGSGYAGVVVKNGGLIVNGRGFDRSALIVGTEGIIDENGTGTIINYGTIKGVVGIRIWSAAPATNAVTVANAGLIEGTGGTALQLGAGNDVLVLATGAAFEGIVNGGRGTNTLALADGSHGAISGLGSKFVDFQRIAVSTGASWTLLGSNTLAGGDLLVDAGALDLGANDLLENQAGAIIGLLGTSRIAGTTGLDNAGLIIRYGDPGTSVISLPLVNSGTVGVAAGTLELAGAITGTGSLDLAAGTVLELSAAVAATQTVTFYGAADLALTDPGGFSATVARFAAEDRIDLRTVTFGTDTELYYAGGVLTVSDGTHAARIRLLGQYAAAGFRDATDGHGGTVVTYAAPSAAPVPLLASPSG